MHELSLAQGVVQILCEEAAQHGIKQVERFQLEVGVLRAVVPELLSSCLEFASQGTLVEGAAAEIVVIQGQARCTACQHEFAVGELFFLCPQCGQWGGTILAGEELRVVELEGE